MWSLVTICNFGASLHLKNNDLYSKTDNKLGLGSKFVIVHFGPLARSKFVIVHFGSLAIQNHFVHYILHTAYLQNGSS